MDSVNELRGTDFLEEYRKNKDKYLPICPAVWEYDSGIGWNCGLFTENRPFFCDCWATDGLTLLDYIILYEGLENADRGELFEIFKEKEGIVLSEDYPYDFSGEIQEYGGVKYIRYQILVGDEDNTYLRSGGNIFSYSRLTKYRESINETEE